MRKALLAAVSLLVITPGWALPPGECFFMLACRWQGYQVCTDTCPPWNWDLLCDTTRLYCKPPELDPLYEGDVPTPPAPPANPRDVNRDGRIDCWRETVKGYTGDGTCCQGWGVDDSECTPPCGRGHRHGGQDLAAPCGTLVRSAGRGTVLAWGDNHPTMGNWVQLALDDGRYVVYMHLQTIEAWAKRTGASAYPGAILGRVGDTGSASGCHLHLQVQTVAQLPAGFANTLDPKSVFSLC